MITLRHAQTEDANLVHSLIKELADYERAVEEVKVTELDLRKQLSSARRPFECLIAESNGITAGFAIYFFGYSTWEGAQTLYLEDLFVRPQFRGERVGQALMSKLAEIAQVEDCSRFEWSVLDWNELAINFYDRLGASPQQGWTRYRLTECGITSLANQSKVTREHVAV